MHNEKVSKYIENIGWRYETEHSMTRRMSDHDYQSRCIYMITMCVEGRLPLLGELREDNGFHIEPSELGREVKNCWYAIPEHYPEVKVLNFQLMPDHIHGLLFVKQDIQAHLGQIKKGFKIGCSKAKWKIEECSALSSLNCNSTYKTIPHKTIPHKTPLFEKGYQDSVLKGKDQLEHMIRYIKDNPRRLGIKRNNPDLFKVVAELEIEGIKFAAIGNRWLLDRPVKMQVRCHNNTSPSNLQLIAKQKEFFLKRGKEGGVVVSPCISAGEKEIARAALDAKQPLIVILENGFPPFYKPPGKYFEACSQGLLLMLAPWPYHMEAHTITRNQCNALNNMAHAISTEPWTQELEDLLSHSRRR